MSVNTKVTVPVGRRSATPASACCTVMVTTLHQLRLMHQADLVGCPGRVDLRCPAVALFHRATITPTKAELIAAWAPTRPWGPSGAEAIEVIGSYRFDDPDGRVG